MYASDIKRGGGVKNWSTRIYQKYRSFQVLASSSSSKVPFTISIKKKVSFGESIKAVGDLDIVGKWDISKGVDLKWGKGNHWTSTVEVPVGAPLRFKLVVVGEQDSVWEQGEDRKVTALGPDYGLKMSCEWGNTEGDVVESFKLVDNASSSQAGGHSSTHSASSSQSKASGSSTQSTAVLERAAVSTSTSGSTAGTMSTYEEEARGPGHAWVGTEPEFVRSKKEWGPKERVNNKEGLSGVALELVTRDDKSENWLSKLDLVKTMLVDKSPMKRPGSEVMAAAYIYTTWINTGAIACAESRSHYRPNHHADLAMEMFRSLEWVIGDTSSLYSPKGTTTSPTQLAAAVMAARRMHARLPSISGEFRQSVPLTRIRDIAHRGDIPRDVKEEIKHTLQNKLHRCAGPEDLVAAERMLKRITAVPGEYSQPFVEEFKIFMKELREFFNASGLEELLARTKDGLEEQHLSALMQFQAAKAKVESSNKASVDDLMTLLFSATQARTFYVSQLSGGLRNDTTDGLLENRQRWRLADVRLEEYCFVVLSRLVNALEEQGGSGLLSKAGNQAWALPLSALAAGLRNLGLSQFRAKELLLLENELQAWHNAAPLVNSGRDNALRAKASLDRVMRVAAEYSDVVMKLYTMPASDLGKGLGVPSHMASVFGESEVRASVAFQVSKLAALMSKALRMASGQSAWDGLVTGMAVGTLREVSSLNPASVDAIVAELKGHGNGGAHSSTSQPPGFILVVAGAEGDEELGPLVPLGLRGVILRQELPHLSHLGVRARQEKVTFATLDDAEQYNQLVKPLLGRTARLEVLPGSVNLGPASDEDSKKAGKLADVQKHSSVKSESSTAGSGSEGWSGAQRITSATVVPLSKATVSTCGSKSAKCAELERLAVTSGGLFKTAKGCCLPFGTMDLAIAAAGKDVANKYKALLDELDSPSVTGLKLDDACKRMEELIRQLQLPGALLEKVRSGFQGSDCLLAVRSSANVEDLAGMSAAGLYESVVGVKADDPEAVRAAAAAVWASLYTRRAVLSRRTAGVPQHAATMAVLIQELHCPQLSFVLHTARPSDGNTGVVLVEAAPGQGETLAAATAGTPWRFEVEKRSGKVDTLVFANFSRALQLVPSRGLVEVEVDYSKQRVTVDEEYRKKTAQRLAAAGSSVEAHFNGEAQDIEGGLVTKEGEFAAHTEAEADLYIFQTRPQL